MSISIDGIINGYIIEMAGLFEGLMIPADLSNLHIIEDKIDEVRIALGIDESIYGNLLVAVTEAVNNAIIHGSNGREKNDILLNSRFQNGVLEVEVNDFGEGFDYINLPDPTSPENLEKEHGRGVFLMRMLSDKVDFENNGSKVILTFNLPK